LKTSVHALADEHVALSEQVKAKLEVKQRRSSIVAAGGGDDAALRAENKALKAENARVIDEVDARVKAGVDKVKAEAARQLSESEAANAALRGKVVELENMYRTVARVTSTVEEGYTNEATK
jgi:hypothetical protein